MSNNSVQTVSTSAEKLKVGLALFAVIAGVVAFYLLRDKAMAMRAGALVAGLVVAAGLALTAEFGRNFIGFAKETVRETKKVVWPTRKEAMQITAVVFGFVLIMAIFLWGTDKLLEVVLYDVILGWGKK